MSDLHLLRRLRTKTARVVRGALVTALLAVNFGSASFVPAAQATFVNLSDVTVVPAGEGSQSSFALKSDGSVFAWGSNGAGQLGDGTLIGRTTPVQVSGLGVGSGVIALAKGTSYSLALKSDGTVLAWGGNALFQLGDGTTTNRSTPAQVSGLGSGSGVIAIAAASAASFALKSDGTVWSWGSNANGQLGDGTTTSRSTPVQVHGVSNVGFLTGISTIAAGNNFGMAIKSDGTVFTWGSNANGQLGDSTTTQRTSPVQVTGLGSGSGVIAVAGGTNHGFALKSDGTVLGWGGNSTGQLGDSTTTQRTSPVQATGLGSGSGVTAISTGNGYTLALKSDGTVLAWGNNANGQVGDGTTTQRTSFVQVSGLGSGSGVTGVSANSGTSFALKSDGTVLSWGANGAGQLGNGTIQGSTFPVVVPGLSSVTYLAAGAGGTHSLVLKSDGTVWAWGTNSNGQLGDSSLTNALTPVQVHGVGNVGFLTGISAIVAGSNFSMALKSDGTVYAWGGNANGQLGDSSTTQRTTPVQVTGFGSGSGVIAINAGQLFAMALKSDGTVLAWGVNTNNQLGDGTLTQRTSPVQVTGLGSGSGATAIAAGSIAGFVLKSDGTVLGWGANNINQLGDGTTTQRSSPVQVTGLGSGSGVVTLSSGSNNSFAVKSDSSVYGWGGNANGQLGDGTTNQPSVPVQISGLGTTPILATGGTSGSQYSLARKSDGTAFGWGINSSGTLGDGSVASVSAPVQVHGEGNIGFLTNVTKVSTGGNFALALKSDGTVVAWGANTSGQLGDGSDYSANFTPQNVGGNVESANCPTSSVTLSAPNGGEALKAGQEQLVLWSVSGCNIFGFRLSLSTDGGATYPTPLAVSQAGAGYAVWTVPDGINTSSARMRIEALTYGDAVAATDDSDGSFSIEGTPAPEEELAPNALSAPGPGSFSPAAETAEASSINDDSGIAPAENAPCVSGTRIKGGDRAVYYCGADGRRYVFPNVPTYHSWFPDFSGVITMPDEALAAIPLGGNVTYRPGVRMVKVASDPKVYVVARGGVLRPVQSEEVARALYGGDWNSMIDDVSDAFFADYSVGEPVTSADTTVALLSRTLAVGSTGPDVVALQRLLNAMHFTVASSGPGSPGHESAYFGAKTQAALQRFQVARAKATGKACTECGGVLGQGTTANLYFARLRSTFIPNR